MFDFESLTADDHAMVLEYLGGKERAPDLCIAPDGHPYLYRWHLIPRSYTRGNVYLHVQVADDPERPLHDHPWDNMSVILAGGYIETIGLSRSGLEPPFTYHNEDVIRQPGDVIFRHADQAHHLRLKPGEPYSISQFTTGPKVREWGFYAPGGWVPANSVIENTVDGRSIYVGPRSHT